MVDHGSSWLAMVVHGWQIMAYICVSFVKWHSGVDQLPISPAIQQNMANNQNLTWSLQVNHGISWLTMANYGF